MTAILNTNMSSLTAQYYLSVSNSQKSTSMEQLSSGKKVNSAKDNPSGMSIIQNEIALENGLRQGIINAGDGISLSTTAEKAVGGMVDQLQLIRQLTENGLNSTQSVESNAALQLQINGCIAEIDRLGADTSFNGINMLASDRTFTFQVGAMDKQTIALAITKLDSTVLGINGFLIPVPPAAPAGDELSKIDAALQIANTARTNLGISMNRLDSVIDNQTVGANAQAEALSRIQDTDYAQATSDLAKTNVLVEAGTEMLITANQEPKQSLELLASVRSR